MSMLSRLIGQATTAVSTAVSTAAANHGLSLPTLAKNGGEGQPQARAQNDSQIDAQMERIKGWAKANQAEAEQLAFDASRLMACTTDRLDQLGKQQFAQRCWSRLSGKTGEMERANTADLIQMQGIAYRYINMLQEQQVLTAHSLLSLKNNLCSLSAKVEENRNLIGLLAQRTLERFESLENRVDQIEISTNLQGWLLGLEEREYDKKIPTEYMRLLRVINDFYGIKNDNWNYNDIMFMRKAIRTVGLDPAREISLNTFIDGLVDEIHSDAVGFDAYGKALAVYQPQSVGDYSQFVLDNVSSPVFTSLHALKMHYIDRVNIVEALKDKMNITTNEALKLILRQSIADMNVNLDYQFPLADAAIEILGCLRLARKLANGDTTTAAPMLQGTGKAKEHWIDAENIELGQWQQVNIKKLLCKDFTLELDEDCSFVFINNKFINLTKSALVSGHDLLMLGTANFSDPMAWQLIANYKGANSSHKNGLWYLDNKFFTFSGSKLLFSESADSLISAKEAFTKFSPMMDFIRSEREINSLKEPYDDLLKALTEPVESVLLPRSYSDNEITYEDIFFNGTNWYLVGEHESPHSQKKEGIIFDSIENVVSKSKVILHGKSLHALKTYSFSQDFLEYDVEHVKYSNGFIFACLSKSDYSDDLFAYSKDELNWSSTKMSVDDICSFNGELIIQPPSLSSDDGFYSFNPSSQILSKLGKTNISFDFTFKVKTYDEYGVALSHSYMYNCNQLFITNDMKNWNSIELPLDSDSSFTNIGFCIAGEYLIIWNEATIHYCHIK